MSNEEVNAWGAFYAKLHRLAESIRQEQRTAPGCVSEAQPDAATEATVQANQRQGDFATLPEELQKAR